jgi:hypothetical protein
MLLLCSCNCISETVKTNELTSIYSLAVIKITLNCFRYPEGVISSNALKAWLKDFS